MAQSPDTTLAIIKLVHRLEDTLPDSEDLGACLVWEHKCQPRALLGRRPTRARVSTSDNTQPLLPPFPGGAAGNSLAELEFNDFYSLRRPKHVFAGISSGTQSVAKGTASGAAALVGAPVVGAYTVRPRTPDRGLACRRPSTGAAGAVVHSPPLPVTMPPPRAASLASSAAWWSAP